MKNDFEILSELIDVHGLPKLLELTLLVADKTAFPPPYTKQLIHEIRNSLQMHAMKTETDRLAVSLN